MLLVIAATEIEMKPFLSLRNNDGSAVKTIVCGVGPVEAAVSVTRILEKYRDRIHATVNFGIAGAYLKDENAARMLDLCVAEREVLGDYGVSLGEGVEPFTDPALMGQQVFSLDRNLRERAVEIVRGGGDSCVTGTFITVNAASGTRARGGLLCRRFDGLCENMEGAAVARVCHEYSVPMLEIRAVSNLVEDRPGTPWMVEEACRRVAVAASHIIDRLLEEI